MLLGETPARRVIAMVEGAAPNAPTSSWCCFTARPDHRTERWDYRRLKAGSGIMTQLKPPVDLEYPTPA